jgi:hypothetical protein
MDFSIIPLPAIVLLVILYLIDAYISDGQPRNRNNNAGDNNGENNKNVNTLPSPLPTLE